MNISSWAFFFALLSSGAPAAVAADAATAASGIQGAATYPPNATAPARPTTVNVPTPDTVPPPSGGTPTTGGIPVNTNTATTISLGRYRNSKLEVNLESMLHDRYKQSVVRVTAKDLAGNVLARAMGVGVGRNAQFIAVPLSLVLGTSQQWADRIEITHAAGNRYNANVALIDEEKNLALLSPEANPAPIVFTPEINERPQIDVFSISFENGPDGSITSSIHRGKLAAANPETGLLSVSPYPGQVIDDAQAGTGLINSEGNLVGMLLPGGRGVLASTLQRSIAKAAKAKPIEPSKIGVILGRGVLVDPKLPGAYRSISAALEAIKKGEAPKTDPTRYTPARNRTVAPKETDKVVIKVMPGKYRETKPIVLPDDISLSGAGGGLTTLIGTDPGKPVVLVQDSSNVMIAGLRIVPAALQSLKAPAVIVSQANNVTLLGNVFEAKGGVAVWLHGSQNVKLHGNTFARGTSRGLSCDKSSMELEANAFVGDWPLSIAIDKECSATLQRNLFLDNKDSIAVSATAGTTLLQQNTFVRSRAGVKLNGNSPRFSLFDNVFFECSYGLTSSTDLSTRNIGRNAAWRSRFVARSKPILQIDLVRTEPTFQAPASYDFRILPGKGHSGSALRTPGADLGAFQKSDFLGPYSGTLARTLGAATREDDLAGTWGLPE